MNKPFSIVVPVYNREHLVTRCLDSIHAQTYRPIRLIIVDNASTDSSRAVIESWARLHSAPDFQVTILDEPKKGAATARNRGLTAVDTDYIAFFDSDDAMRPDFVTEAVKALDSLNGPLRIAIWKEMIHFPDSRSRVLKYAGHDLLRNHIIHGIVSTECFAATTELIRRAGGWNDDLRGWDDWELGIRMLLMRPEIKCVPKILVDTYFTEESITGTTFSAKCGVWERAIGTARTAILSAHRDDARRLEYIIDYVRIILAANYSKEARKYHRPKWQHNASRLLASVLSNYPERSLRRQILLLAYRYTAAGHRGAAALLRPFL